MSKDNLQRIIDESRNIPGVPESTEGLKWVSDFKIRASKKLRVPGYALYYFRDDTPGVHFKFLILLKKIEDRIRVQEHLTTMIDSLKRIIDGDKEKVFFSQPRSLASISQDLPARLKKKSQPPQVMVISIEDLA
ncbi:MULTISPECIES: hypothetical protein [unclassified Moorena]|uniref:hypothetical protein n=1 Tax=unclassified Moorena TaxID=2683338 RepID=UPI0025F8BD4B|nr:MULTISPECIES: hypothetical protein [unclassified Moorena]